MSTEIHPPLGTDADAAPHDEYCTKLMAKMPPEVAAAGPGCLCGMFALIRADECIKISKQLDDCADIDGARIHVTERLVQHTITALLSRGKR